MSVFQTNAWQRSWWNIWGGTKGFTLVEDSGQCATGLYIDRYFFKGILPVRALQFVGTSYRRISTPRSEYNTLFSVGGGTGRAASELLKALVSTPWTEAVFRDVRESSADIHELKNLAAVHGWLWRVVDDDTAYSINTSFSWNEYLAALGSNTRLRLFNRRKLIEGLGTVNLVNAWPDQTDWFFDLLNDFHAKRWGQPCFNERSQRFHKEFLARVPQEGGDPELSILTVDGNPISVLYNVAFEGCVYNIQAGFIEGFHKKLAVGTLHLGYSIEDAFRHPDIARFDMLAGEGKHENYKSRLATDSEKLLSFMVVRSPFFQWLYRLKG